MVQDQYSETQTRTDLRKRSSLADRRPRFALTLRHLLISVVLTVLLICIEGILWILNPAHLLGSDSSRAMKDFLTLPHIPFLLLVLLGEFGLVSWLTWLVTRPLAQLAYLKAVYLAQERYRRQYTPLQTWSYPYDVPIVFSQDDPDPTLAGQDRSLTVLELIEKEIAETSSHLILQGEPGAGKSMFLHELLSTAAQRRWEIAFGKLRLPVFLPLKYYAFLHQELGQEGSQGFSLLDFLSAADLPGLDHLRPYLNGLFQRGRLLFLCDSLDEVPAASRLALDRELALLLRQNRNGLLLTCTPEVYAQSPELVQLVGENLVPLAVLQPLELTDVRSIVERFVGEIDNNYSSNLPTAGQIMAAIEQTRLRLCCSTPLYLFALLEVIRSLPLGEVRYLDTRGHLLRAFLQSLLQKPWQDRETLPEELVFLGDLACVARWNGDDNLVFLPGGGFLAQDLRASPTTEQMETLVLWMREQPVIFPFEQETIFVLSEMVEPNRAIALLREMQQVALIEIDGQGMLSFRHPLIASALLALYLARFMGSSALRVEALETFPDDLGPWSEPLTLWAGMLERPEEASATLATYAVTYPDQSTNVLITSLICMGVAQTPSGVDLAVPSQLAEALGDMLNDRQAMMELAELFTRCAEHGSPELYQALFPLLAIEGIEAWLALLDPAVVSELFFQRLVEVIDETEQEVLVKRLVRALGSLGASVVPRAASLCTGRVGTSLRLRTAAINVLGGTHDESAVEPLLDCLRDTDRFIVIRAANALVRLGPNLTFQRLVRELEMRTPENIKKPLHWIILPILERFLNEGHPARQLAPAHAERIIAALLHVQATHTIPADVEKAREILVSHGRSASDRETGKIAINLLVQNLATADAAVARSMTGTLKEVGEVAIPQLLEQLENQPSESERVRILEILTSVRDLRALEALLILLEDNSLVVQQALATALSVYAPECIPGLIGVVLHHSDELVAARSEQMLCGLGTVVVEPVIQSMTPVIPGRTLLLVHVLEATRDARMMPALLALLQSDQSDVQLTLAIVQAFGQSADKRAISPLLDMLNNTNPLLSEGAINALSKLGELAYAELLAKLDVPEKTPLVTRIERVLLSMQPFPGSSLLQSLDKGSENQLRYIEEILIGRGSDAAQLLAANLFHARPRVRQQVRQTLSRMETRYSVPALLEVLSEPDPAWRDLVASYLLNHPQEALPALVGLLDDPKRGDAAVGILIQAGPPTLPVLVPALDANPGQVRTRASSILVTLVQRQPGLLAKTVQLFGLPLPPRAYETVARILTEELAEVSLSALMNGLEDAHLVRDVAGTLVRLARRNSAQQVAVLHELLQALSIKPRRAGASQALIDLGAAAVLGVGALITHRDAQIAHTARQILGAIGTPALPFIWAAHSDASDPARREAAREVFHAMPTSVIKDELVELLTSARQEEISMALSLLLERIQDEELQPGRASEMLPALLEHVQSSADERVSLRIMALLILLGGPMVAKALIDALYANDQRHEHLVQAFLLLGQSVEADLLAILRDTNAPMRLHAEVAGVLAMRTPHRDVRERALSLSEHGLWAGRSIQNNTTVLQPSQLEVSLRALGGLLIAGHWNAQELQNLRSNSTKGSAERELYNILLGWRYSPQIMRLEDELHASQAERKKELLQHAQELLTMKAQIVDLEQDLEQLQSQHREQSLSHEQKSKEFQGDIARLTKEKQTLQADLRQAQQEKQALSNRVQQAVQEKEHAHAEMQRWQTYGQQLERENTALKRPPSNA